MANSMDDVVAVALFQALAKAQQNCAGMFRIDASNPEGVQGLVCVALDEVAFLQRVEPALRAARIEVVKVEVRR